VLESDHWHLAGVADTCRAKARHVQEVTEVSNIHGHTPVSESAQGL
jgi:hypothetical protein